MFFFILYYYKIELRPKKLLLSLIIIGLYSLSLKYYNPYNLAYMKLLTIFTIITILYIFIILL
jgi:hypothetical protein